MSLEEKLVENARSWIGTPWMHNQQLKGIGVDCIRFLEAVAIESGLTIEPLPKHYCKTPTGNAFKDYLDRNFIKTGTIELGTILLFEVKGICTHVGIATNNDRFIHAGTTGVIEMSLNGKFAKRLKGIYRCH